MKFGCCASYENYGKVKELGYDYIELSASEMAALSPEVFAKFVAEVGDRGFPCRGFNDYCKHVPVLAGPAFHEGEIRSYAKKVMARGNSLSIETLGIGAPTIRQLPPDFPKEKAHEQCRRFLSILLEEAKPFGITLLFESVHDKMCNYCNTMEEAAIVVGDMARKDLQLVADFYHMQVMEERVESIVPMLPLIAHTHVSGCGPHFERPFLTEKDMPYLVEIMKLLEENHWDIAMSVECSDLDFAVGAGESLALLRRAKREARMF